MANSKLFQQADENPESDPDIAPKTSRSQLRTLLSKLKNRVKKYRQDNEGQVYLNSNFKLDN